MALNCHGKSAIDVAASQELKDRLLYEYRGHCLLEACRQADLSKAKKLLSSSSNSSSAVAELLAFKHPYTGKTFLTLKEAGGVQNDPMSFQLAAISHRIMLWSQKFLTLSINMSTRG